MEKTIRNMINQQNDDLIFLTSEKNEKLSYGEIKIFNENNISSKHIETIENYSTTLKQRIYCNDVQVARVDKEEPLNWNPNQLENSLDYSDYDVIILSDYDKGVLVKPV